MVSYTAFADYILMNPSAEYEEIMARVHEKIYLSKASCLFVHVLCYVVEMPQYRIFMLLIMSCVAT